jgi:hypothetical protein
MEERRQLHIDIVINNESEPISLNIDLNATDNEISDFIYIKLQDLEKKIKDKVIQKILLEKKAQVLNLRKICKDTIERLHENTKLNKNQIENNKSKSKNPKTQLKEKSNKAKNFSNLKISKKLSSTGLNNKDTKEFSLRISPIKNKEVEKEKDKKLINNISPNKSQEEEEDIAWQKFIDYDFEEYQEKKPDIIKYLFTNRSKSVNVIDKKQDTTERTRHYNQSSIFPFYKKANFFPDVGGTSETNLNNRCLDTTDKQIANFKIRKEKNMFKEIQNDFINKLNLYEKDDVFSMNSNTKPKSTYIINSISTSKYLKNSFSGVKSKVGDMKKNLKESSKKNKFNNKNLMVSSVENISLASNFPNSEYNTDVRYLFFIIEIYFY